MLLNCLDPEMMHRPVVQRKDDDRLLTETRVTPDSTAERSAQKTAFHLFLEKGNGNKKAINNFCDHHRQLHGGQSAVWLYKKNVKDNNWCEV